MFGPKVALSSSGARSRSEKARPRPTSQVKEHHSAGHDCRPNDPPRLSLATTINIVVLTVNLIFHANLSRINSKQDYEHQ